MTGRTEDKAGILATECEGEPLTQYVARVGRLPMLQGFALGLQLLWALDELHRSGMGHGGLAFDRLLVGRTGRLVVPGLEAQASMPPTLGVAATRPAQEDDIAAAAAVTYELLTGAPPLRESPGPVRAFRPELPIALDAVFERALARRAAERYPTAADLSAALQAAMPAPHWDRSSPLPSPLRQPSPPPPAGTNVAARDVPLRAPALRARPVQARTIGLVLAAACAAVAVLAGTTMRAGHSARLARIDDFQVTAPAGFDTDAPSQQQAAVRVEPSALVLPAGEGSQPAAQRDRAATPQREDVAVPEPQAPAVVSAPRAIRRRGSERVAHHPTVRGGTAHVAHALPPGPDASCRSDLAFAPELCTAFRCATAEFRQHPVCVRMHAEGARARARLADTHGGP